MRSLGFTIVLILLATLHCGRGFPETFPWGYLLLGEVATSANTTTTTATPTVDDYSTLVSSETSLLAFWRLNEAATNGTANTDIRGGFNGTFTGATGTPTSDAGATNANDSDNGYTLTAGAGDDYRVVVPAPAGLQFTAGQSMTLELWAKPRVLNEKMDILTHGRIDGLDDANFSIRINGAKVGFFFGTTAGATNVSVLRTDDFILRKDEWYHIVVTHTYGSIADSAIYINGIERNSSWVMGSGTETPDTPGKDLWIGASNGPAAGAVDNVFDGTVDDVAIYNSILSQDTIRSHYRSANNKLVQFLPSTKILGINENTFLVTNGGTSPFSYSVVSGNGSISSSGLFSAPGTMGSTTVRVTDADGSTDDVTLRHFVEPDDLGGMLVWFKGDAQTYSADSAIPILVDSSGSGNDGTQGTAANQPTFTEGVANGLPVITFDGTNDSLQLPITTDANTISFTVTGIFQSNAVNAAILDQGGGTNPILLHRNTCVALGDLQSGFACPAPAYTAGTPVIHSSVFTAGVSVDYFTDGTTSALGSGTAFGVSTANWNVGSLGGSFFLTGVIGELIIFNSAIGAANREAIECYLSVKYDQAVDAGHGCP